MPAICVAVGNILSAQTREFRDGWFKENGMDFQDVY